MSQRHYLLNTSIDSSDCGALNKALASEGGKVVEVAECVTSVPLPWFACFRSNDLRPCTVQMSSGPSDIMVPCVDLPTAIANLHEALPLFEALTGEKNYARQYWQSAIDDLRKLPLAFLTMDIGEMLMNCEAEELVTKMTTALGRNSDAIAVMKEFFLEYDTNTLPYERSAFYANQDITDKIRIRNTIALDAAIQQNGFARTPQAEIEPEAPTLAPETSVDEQIELDKLDKSREKYILAGQSQNAGDYQQAIILYREAIALADSSRYTTDSMFTNGSAAACNLADKYEHGLGVPQDYQLALEWYRKSAAKKNYVAQYSLGMMYKQGLGVQADNTIALDWFLKSAGQGYADAETQVREFSVAVRSRAPIADNGFVAGTLVHTKDGLKPIEEIKLGDWVMTNAENAVRLKHYDEIKDIIYRQVTALFAKDDVEIIELQYTYLGRGKAYLRLTPSHPVMVSGVGWMTARELQFGHLLMLGCFGNVLFPKVKALTETARVYNIQVDEFQTYFVGEYGAWVHNGGGDISG